MSLRVLVAGHTGMVGGAILRRLHSQEEAEIVTVGHAEVDLTDTDAVRVFLGKQSHIDHFYLAAARVGGIHPNSTRPAEYILDNLAIQTNVLRAAHEAGIDRVLFLGSSCIYPRLAAQPIQEGALLTGSLEVTNEPYAIAKIAGIKTAESINRQYGRDYRTVMPTNLYGPGDNFDLQDGHVLPALIRRFHEAAKSRAREVVVWGTGAPRREFLHVDDLADACVYIMSLDRDTFWRNRSPMSSHINIGTGSDCSIAQLAAAIAKITEFTGSIRYETNKPDGTPRKLLDVSQLANLGWRASISLEEGISSTYRWFCEHQHDYRGFPTA